MASAGAASASGGPPSAAEALAAAEHAAQEAPRDAAARSRAGAAAFAARRFGDAKRHFLAAAALEAGAEPPALDAAAAAAAPIPSVPPPSADLARWLRKCDAELSLAAGGPPVGISPAPARPAAAPPAPAAARAAADAPSAATPAAPLAKRTPRDWSALEKEVEAEEKATKLEGDAALNSLFRDLYARADDDTRRAMVKSYTESGGTALSTDWRSVGKATVPVEPPDGMIARKFGE